MMASTGSRLPQPGQAHPCRAAKKLTALGQLRRFSGQGALQPAIGRLVDRDLIDDGLAQIVGEAGMIERHAVVTQPLHQRAPMRLLLGRLRLLLIRQVPSEEG